MKWCTRFKTNLIHTRRVEEQLSSTSRRAGRREKEKEKEKTKNKRKVCISMLNTEQYTCDCHFSHSATNRVKCWNTPQNISSSFSAFINKRKKEVWIVSIWLNFCMNIDSFDRLLHLHCQQTIFFGFFDCKLNQFEKNNGTWLQMRTDRRKSPEPKDNIIIRIVLKKYRKIESVINWFVFWFRHDWLLFFFHSFSSFSSTFANQWHFRVPFSVIVVCHQCWCKHFLQFNHLHQLKRIRSDDGSWICYYTESVSVV